jgi:folate-dependent phosphoribosylglycinamide formyltransferase PurN
MKIILWIGNEPNQKALANKLHSVFPITGIVLETRISKRKFTLRLILEKVIEKIFLSSIWKSWWGMLEYYEKKYPNYPKTEILEVENINSEKAYDFTKECKPDLILVSGTRMIKENMLAIHPSIGILNLHTGLSPYVKGGPNCTNWCIANKNFHLIGNTIMWIDKGIDTGNILTTEFTSLSGDENLPELHLKVMEHAHDLYINAVKFLETGNKQSIKQSDIANGSTFYTKQWTLKQKINLAKNYSLLRKQYENGIISNKQKDIKTIEIKRT